MAISSILEPILKPALALTVTAGICLAIDRPAVGVGPNLLQIFARIIGWPIIGGLVCGGAVLLIQLAASNQTYGDAYLNSIVYFGVGAIGGAIKAIMSIALSIISISA